MVDHDLSNYQRRENYKVISKQDGAIVLGDSLKWIFKGMLPDKKIFVVPNCVDDIYLMNDEEFEEKLNELDKKNIKHILYLSNFIKSKGYPEVLEMVRMEKERCKAGGEKKFHFDFAGKFFEKEEEIFFFEYIKKYELDDFITYHGIVDGEKKRNLLKKSDIFVLLTRYPNEGQPIAILEAMGNGMAIVTTNHAGIPDIVKGGINGIVATKESSIRDIYDNLHNCVKITTLIDNRNTIKMKYTEKAYLDTLSDIFINMIREE